MVKPVKKKVATGVYGEVIKLFGPDCARQGNEKFYSWVERVGAVIGDAPEDVAAKMSEAAGDWYDKTCDAASAEPPTALPPVTGWPEDVAAPEVETQPEVKPAAPAAEEPEAPAAEPKKEQATVATPKKKAAKKPAAVVAKKKALPVKKAAKPAAKAAKKVAAKKPKQATLPGVANGGPKARPDSVAFKMRVAVVKSPDVTFEAALKAAGVKGEERGGNAWNAYFNARQVMAIASAEGVLKK